MQATATAVKKNPPTTRQKGAWPVLRPQERAENGERPDPVPRERIVAVGALVLQRKKGTRYACDIGLPVGRRRNRRGTATAIAAGEEDVVRAPFRSTVLRGLLEWVTEACVSPRRRGALLVFTCARFVVGSADEWAALLGGSEKTFQRAVHEALQGNWIVYHRRSRQSAGGSDCRCHRTQLVPDPAQPGGYKRVPLQGPHREEITPAIEPGPALLEHLNQVLGNRVHPSERSHTEASSPYGRSSDSSGFSRGDSESSPSAPTLASAREIVVAAVEAAPTAAKVLPLPTASGVRAGEGVGVSVDSGEATTPRQLAQEVAEERRSWAREALADGFSKGSQFARDTLATADCLACRPWRACELHAVVGGAS